MAIARRAWFWSWIAVGTVLVALGAASLGSAFANRGYEEPAAGWTNYGPLASADYTGDFLRGERCLDCGDPTPWLAVGIALVVAGAAPFLVATRRR